MQPLLLNIHYHSQIDLITNSSSVVYINSTDSGFEALQEMVSNILKAGGSTSTASDLFRFHTVPVQNFSDMIQNDSYGYDEEDGEGSFSKDALVAALKKDLAAWPVHLQEKVIELALDNVTLSYEDMKVKYNSRYYPNTNEILRDLMVEHAEEIPSTQFDAISQLALDNAYYDGLADHSRYFVVPLKAAGKEGELAARVLSTLERLFHLEGSYEG